MKIEEAKILLKEKFGVEVSIVDDSVFKGKIVTFFYCKIVDGEMRRKQFIMSGVETDDWKKWANDNKWKIRKRLMGL